MKDAIKSNELLTDIQKKIAIRCIESEGRIQQEDLANEFNITQQSVSYHLKRIREKENFM